MSRYKTVWVATDGERDIRVRRARGGGWDWHPPESSGAAWSSHLDGVRDNLPEGWTLERRPNPRYNPDEPTAAQRRALRLFGW